MLGKFHSSVKLLFWEWSANEFFDFSRFLVFSLLVHGCDECASLHLICRTVLSVLVEDSGVPQTQFFTDCLQTLVWEVASVVNVLGIWVIVILNKQNGTSRYSWYFLNISFISSSFDWVMVVLTFLFCPSDRPSFCLRLRRYRPSFSLMGRMIVLYC